MNKVSMSFVVLMLISTLGFAQQYHDADQSLPCLEKNFSLVVHVFQDTFGNLGIDTASIRTEFEQMNSYFEPICASFTVCEFQIHRNFQYNDIENQAEWEEIQIKFHQPHRINVFFVSSTIGIPSLGDIAELNESGIVYAKSNLREKWLAHKVGHYFGLFHTFGGTNAELVDGSNCATEGDEICDTPADPFVLGTPMGSYIDTTQNTPTPCLFVGTQTDANGEYYIPDVGNIMSMYPDYCKCAFSYDQFLKMANTYLNSPAKMW